MAIVVHRRIRTTPLTEDQKTRVKELHKEGFGINTIARMVESKSSVVHTFMKQNGLRRSREESIEAYKKNTTPYRK